MQRILKKTGTQVFWGVKLCHWGYRYHHFEGSSYLHQHGQVCVKALQSFASWHDVTSQEISLHQHCSQNLKCHCIIKSVLGLFDPEDDWTMTLCNPLKYWQPQPHQCGITLQKTNHENFISARAAVLCVKTPEWQVVIRTWEIRKNVRYDNLLLFRISTGCLLNTQAWCTT